MITATTAPSTKWDTMKWNTENCEDTKEVIRSHQSKDKKLNVRKGQQVKQWSTKHYTEN